MKLFHIVNPITKSGFIIKNKNKTKKETERLISEEEFRDACVSVSRCNTVKYRRGLD